jgi:hypothetical protein
MDMLLKGQRPYDPHDHGCTGHHGIKPHRAGLYERQLRQPPLASISLAYPEIPNAFLTACPIGTNGFSCGEEALNIRLWVMATARRVSGSAHPIDPPAPGWPKVRGLRPAGTMAMGGGAWPIGATRWNPPMLPLWGMPCT